MQLIAIRISQRIRVNIPVTTVVGFLRSLCCQDSGVVSFNLPIRFGVICSRKGSIYEYYTTDVLEGLWHDASAIVNYKIF